MAARLLGCAAASVTAVGGSAAFLRRPVLADEQPQSAPATPAATKKKLSIYDEPEPATQLVPTPVPLQAEVAVVREHVQSAYRVAHERVYGAVGDWIKFESSVEDEVKSIVPKDCSETVAIGREHAAAAWGNAQQR